VASRLATLEASYADRDAEFTQCLSQLESIRVGHVSVEGDDRVKQLDATTGISRPGAPVLMASSTTSASQ
jgi:hypothetical protein